MKRKHVLALVAGLILILALVLRLAAARGDFFMDEIWSWMMARKFTSALQIFTQFELANNHLLNTFFVYILGDQHNWVIYRIPAVVFGIGAVALAGMIGRLETICEALIAMFLMSFSYLMILYSSEARGYAPLVFSAFLCFYALRRYLRERRWIGPGLFCVGAFLGILSHLAFLHFYAAAFIWSCYEYLRHCVSWRKAAIKLAQYHTVPMLFFILMYYVYYRTMEIDGGPPYVLSQVLLSTMSLSVGGPEYGSAMVACAFVAVLIFMLSGLMLWRERIGLWIFFVIIIILLPGMLLLSKRPPYLSPRYFLISTAFFLLLCSRFLSALMVRSGAGKGLCVLLLVAFACTNGWQTWRLLKLGRGNYHEALTYIASHTNSQTITVGSDHDFRNRIVLQFYARYLPRGKTVLYYPDAALPQSRPEWFILHRLTPHALPPMALTVEGDKYLFVRAFRYGSLSGMCWFVYHKATPEKK